MSARVFEARVARGIAPDDRARQERLKATARALVTAVRDGLVRDGVVRLHGFGTFRLRPAAARRGRHPRTGEPIEIPAGWRVLFRPAKALRERVEPERTPALPIGEPQASREAMLASGAAPQVSQPDAGRIPADAPAVTDPEEPRRAAAAPMPESKLSAHGPIPPGDLEADTRVTRSPAALMRAGMRAPVEGPFAGAAAKQSSGGGPAEVTPESPPVPAGTRRRRPGARSAVLILLVLLVAGLIGLLRPGSNPRPPVADQPSDRGVGQTAVDAERGSAGTRGAFGEREAAAIDPAPIDATGDADREFAVAEQAPMDPVAPGTDAPDEPDESGPAGSGPASMKAPDINPIRTADARVPAPATSSTTDDGDLESLPRAGGAPAPTASRDAADGGTRTASVDTETADTGTTGSAASEAERAGTRTGVDEAGSAGARTIPYFDGRDYTVRSGDTLWDLAERNYVNPYYWPHIWNRNDDITNPNRLEVRQGIWLPTLEGDPRSLTAADRRSIAEGYLLLYRFFREQGDANPQYALVGVRYFDVSVLPERLRDTAAGRPGDTLAAAFRARLEAEFPLE